MEKIKTKEDLKNYAIKCSNLNEKLEAVKMLNSLDFMLEDISNCPDNLLISYHSFENCFCECTADCRKKLEFQQFIEISKQLLSDNQSDYSDLYASILDYFENNTITPWSGGRNYGESYIKEKLKELKEMRQKQLPDFESDEDGRVLKINNFECNKDLYILDVFDKTWNLDMSNGDLYIKNILKDMRVGKLFISKESRDKALFKLEIEQQLRTIAHRLNRGERIDWCNNDQMKFCLNCYSNKLCYDFCFTSIGQGVIYCLSRNLLSEAIKEIGEDKLKQYFLD